MFSWLDHNVLWLIPAAPLVASLWIVVAGQFLKRANAHRPVVLALFVAAASAGSEGGMWLGLGAVVLASINIFGGFAVTERMLAMYKKKERK